MLIVSDRLSEHGAELPDDTVFLSQSDFLPTGVAYHTDLRVFCLNENRIVCAPTVYNSLRELNINCNTVCGHTEPHGCYPDDIPYNAAVTGRYIFMNAKHTDPAVISCTAEAGLTAINVRQGYCRCNICTVNNAPGKEAIITEDAGIAQAAEKNGIRVLKLSPGSVVLPGWKNGFIGGASVRLPEGLLFFGEVKLHPEYSRITAFCEEYGCRIMTLKGFQLTDFGGGVYINGQP